MKILDKRTKRVLCFHCERADTPLKRATGLMFANRRKNILFVFDSPGKHPIHAFFVPYKFHAVYLDASLRVVDMFEVRPWTKLARSRRPALFLLEISDGKIPKIGDTLCLAGES